MVELSKKTLRSWTRMQRVHAQIAGAIEHALAGAGLPAFEVHRALMALERGPPEGVRPFELEQALAAPQYQISRLADRLVKAGLAARAPCPDDRRGWRIGLTDAGRATRAQTREVVSAVLAARIADRLGDKQIRQLDDILGDLLDARKT